MNESATAPIPASKTNRRTLVASQIFLSLSFILMMPYLFGFILILASYPVYLQFLYGTIRPIEMIFITCYSLSIFLLLLSQIKRHKPGSLFSRITAVLALATMLAAISLQIYSDVTFLGTVSWPEVIIIMIYLIPAILVAGFVYTQYSKRRSKLAITFAILGIVHAILMLLNVLVYIPQNKFFIFTNFNQFLIQLSFLSYFVGFALFSIAMTLFFMIKRARKT